MGYHMDSIRNIKIFVLYLMENIRRPLDFVTLNDIIMQTDYIMYLDFAEAFHQMEDDGLVAVVGKEGETLRTKASWWRKRCTVTFFLPFLIAVLPRRSGTWISGSWASR